jgi:two-component system nitrogen regulation response regulator NtrX
MGAFDFVEKPLSLEKTVLVISNALRQRRLETENRALRATVDRRLTMIGESYVMAQLREQIAMAAPTKGRVLIHGENGTGKELVARNIHMLSRKRNGPFVEVNCAAIPSELIESELFGHMKGSFTGAVQDRAGKFEQADGGTLFLDEIGDMSLAAQAKVLRVLQDGVVTRIGGSKPAKVDVRVIAATNKELEEEIAAGRFREDLFYRLNVVPLRVPPLRERREDIALLVRHFLALLARQDGLPSKGIEDAAVQRLVELDWPGNVRELRNTVERLLILSNGPRVTLADVERLVGRRASEPGGLGALSDIPTFEEFKHAAERAFLLTKLRQYDWNVSETARALDMPRSNVYKKIERYGLKREDT